MKGISHCGHVTSPINRSGPPLTNSSGILNSRTNLLTSSIKKVYKTKRNHLLAIKKFIKE